MWWLLWAYRLFGLGGLLDIWLLAGLVSAVAGLVWTLVEGLAVLVMIITTSGGGNGGPVQMAPPEWRGPDQKLPPAYPRRK